MQHLHRNTNNPLKNVSMLQSELVYINTRTSNTKMEDHA